MTFRTEITITPGEDGVHCWDCNLKTVEHGGAVLCRKYNEYLGADTEGWTADRTTDLILRFMFRCPGCHADEARARARAESQDLWRTNE